MDFSDVRSTKLHFHPHFLRGVCCDWMKYDLKMDWEEIAQVLGDTEWTVRKDYIDEWQVKSATEAFARISKEREEFQLRAIEVAKAEAASKQKDQILVALERQIQVHADQCDYFKGQHKSVEDKLVIAESENHLKDRQIAALTAEVTLLRSLVPAQTVQHIAA
jgi:predicted transcriptional regulator